MSDLEPKGSLPCGPAGLSAGHLALALLAVLALWFPAAVAPEGRWASLLDNAHWTLAYSLAAMASWCATRFAAPMEVLPRRWLAAGLTCLAAGQWMWDIQVYVGWNPFPGPSDAAFLLPGLCATVAFVQLIRTHVLAARRRHALLDVAGFALVALTLFLALYLPRGSSSTPLQLAVLTAYPVLLVSASAAALVTLLYLRMVWTWRWTALFGGLLGQAILWTVWNLETLSGSLGNGTVLNVAFSVVTLMLGWGISGWRVEVNVSTRFDRLCEGILRQLPLAMIMMTSAAVGLLVLDHTLPTILRGALLAMAMVGLLFAPLRQAMQLGERDRLLAAERNLAESRAKLEYLAHHDALTGLANLALLRKRVDEAIDAAGSAGQGVALLFIDLDQFKEVNDTLGHGTGDALLKHTAQQLEAIVRRSDTVCRHGGDEFAIVLPGVNGMAEVIRVAEKIMRLGEHSASIEGHELPMSMSIGAAFYPDDAKDFAELLQCADIAMYQAKAAGRHAYRFYDARMSEEASERVQMRTRLARAAERGELQLHYQPIVELGSQRVVGAEALLRWQHPELGNVSPAVFIPVAENSGLIVSIGTWVLREACRQARAWHAEGLTDLTVAVNLSMLQFRHGNLEKVVLDALRDSNLPARNLELEVTESVLMEQRDKVTGTLERLRRHGVQVAIDDFGTGYSNIAYLKKLPATKLKVDKSLTHEIATSPRDAAITRTIIQIARELGLSTVAEGVEIEQQRHLLQGFGCDFAQGYLFSAAIPSEQFINLCQRDHLQFQPRTA